MNSSVTLSVTGFCPDTAVDFFLDGSAIGSVTATTQRVAFTVDRGAAQQPPASQGNGLRLAETLRAHRFT